MILAAVACLSLSSLSYELLITRYFSIAQWSHLSFLAVSVAMFGYAAGGTLHSLFGDRMKSQLARRPQELFASLLCAGSLSTIGSFCAITALPLDYLRFPLEAAQAFYLLLTWLLLSLPFLAAGLASSIAYAAQPERSGAISGASLLGAAAGACAPAILLPVLEEGGSVAALALVPLIPLALTGQRAARLGALGLAASIVALFLWQRSGFLDVQPSSYKTLPLLLQAPGASVTSRQAGLRGRLEEVQSPALRFAPGLSLSFDGALPRQNGLVLDDDSLTVLYDLRTPGSSDFARWTHTFAAFLLAGGGFDSPSAQAAAPASLDILVLQQDGGLALACAAASVPRSIVLVTEDPRIARRESQWYLGEPISVVAESPRSFVAKTGSHYSAVFIEDWGPSIPGMASLQADSLLTVEAFLSCWKILKDDGVIAVSRRLVLPPSDSLRIFAAMLLALRQEGIDDPGGHLAVIRSWDSCTIMACRAPLGARMLDRLSFFAQSRSFDLDYYPGIDPRSANRYSRYAQPFFAQAYVQIVSSPGYLDQQALDIVPVSDDRPFPSHFVKWKGMGEFFRATGARINTLFLTGEIIAGAALAEIIVVAAGLLALTFLARRGSSDRGSRRKANLFLLACLSGIGFMGAEMFSINALAPLFSSPTVALSIALGGLLFFSGLGGLVSDRVPSRMLGPTLLAVALVIAGLCVLLPWALSRLQPFPFAPRAAIALLLLGIPGFLIGIPFPAAMRLLPTGPGQRARAWALNGCASVVVSAGSAIIAPAAGVRFLLVLAAAAYAIGAAGVLRASKAS